MASTAALLSDYSCECCVHNAILFAGNQAEEAEGAQRRGHSRKVLGRTGSITFLNGCLAGDSSIHSALTFQGVDTSILVPPLRVRIIAMLSCVYIQSDRKNPNVAHH